MTEAPSQTRIINAALARLGSTSRINSIDDSGNVASTAKALWAETLREQLASHPYNFAIKRATLSRDGSAPESEYDYRYALPNDCLRWLPPWQGGDDYFEGEQEAGYILTDEGEGIVVRYIALIDNVRAWSPGFEQVMIYAMAEAMASAVTQERSTQDSMAEMKERAIRKAKREDGLATGNRRRGAVTSRSDWLAARNIANYHVGR